MTSPNPARMGSFEFFDWLAAYRPALFDGLSGTPYPVATRAVAGRVGFRPAGAAESTEVYLGALQAYIEFPPAPPMPSAWDAMKGWLTTDIDAAPLPVDFAGPEPAPAAAGDPWPRHLCMPSVEWPQPPDAVLRPDREPLARDPAPAFAPAFGLTPEPQRFTDPLPYAWFAAACAAAVVAAYVTTLLLP